MIKLKIIYIAARGRLHPENLCALDLTTKLRLFGSSGTATYFRAT